MQTESVLILGLINGEKEKFDQIYKLYWAELYAFARKRVNFDEDAQDILQDLFVYIWTNRAVIQINTSIKAYLYTALKHRIINYYSLKSNRLKYLEIVKHMALVSDETNEQISKNEIDSIIDDSLEKMPSKMREIFVLSRFKGYSAKQIATQLQLSEQTVRNQISNGLKLVKVNLADFTSVFLILSQNFL